MSITKNKKQKILVIRFSAIGDIVWTSPVIRVLKTQLPNAEIHFCTKYVYREMVSANPYIDQLHFLKDNLGTLVKDLKKEKFDIIIDLHKNVRTLLMKLQLRRKTYSYHKFTLRRWLFVNFKMKTMPNLHVADRYLKTIEPLGVKYDGKGLDFFIPKGQNVDIQQFLPATHQQGYAAFVIGASQFTKILPLDRMLELCKKINRPLVLIGGKEDQVTGDKIAAYFKDNPSDNISIFNACNQLSISQSASIVKQAEVVFGQDTGLTHIAAAFQKQIYAIYGGTSTLGFYPYETPNVILENNDLSCRPCSKSGKSSCPKGHFKCMQDIKFDFEFPPVQTPKPE
jgi:ADP-heptose:LPS heptosyltransferase